MKYLSLCLPTNGISEWVFPVLDRIYEQKADHSEWELIVTDNGDNQNFGIKMKEYADKCDNLIYKKTNAYMFENQIEALRLAEGAFCKFINHRSLLETDVISWMIDIVKDNIDSKPVIYLSNGVLNKKCDIKCNSFDMFVRELGEYVSWTTGVGVWKSDFEHIPADWKYNKISPHSDVLFWEKEKELYLIDDKKWCHDIDESHANKGKYDLYKAFCCDEISIALNLYVDGYITASTLKHVIKRYEKLVSYFYYIFNIRHQPCSYAIDGFDDSINIFLSKRKVLFRAYMMPLINLCSRVLGR